MKEYRLVISEPRLVSRKMIDNDKILLAHGAGGKLTHRLIREVFLRDFTNQFLKPLADSAILKIGSRKLAFTTDSFVVDPVFFPGGDIGSLAVHGTVNDLSVMGARPIYLSCGMIIEEGFEKIGLKTIAASMKRAAKKAGVYIVTGDTKVVERGAADKIFINTSGIGILERNISLSTKKIRPGDMIIASGTIGDHGAAVLSKRKGLEFDTSIRSDSAPLNGLTKRLLGVLPGVKFMRDPTRGGVATTLTEVASEIPFGIEISEQMLPFRKETRALAEILGLDPLYLANEGMAIIVVSAKDSDTAVRTLHAHPLGKKARVIGRITRKHKHLVVLTTGFRGSRIVEMLSGEQLPRIC
jgi:hydrogenase expression/formation protein HypE